MKKSKFLALAAALVFCATASAQFSNVKKGGSSASAPTGLQSGYHAFLEAGYGVGTGDFGADCIELTTSHGYQINPYVFVGAGAGVKYYHGPDAWSVPIFANARGTLLDGPISPFLDIKIGYSAADVSGFYFSPSVGYRFNKFTISAGYELQSVSSGSNVGPSTRSSYDDYLDYYYDYYNNYYYDYSNGEGGPSGSMSAFVFKVGLEF